MRTITFEVPDHVEMPNTIADHAFAHAMTVKYGTMSDVVGAIVIAEPGTILEGSPEQSAFEACAVQVDHYLMGIYDNGTGDPYSPVLEYVDAIIQDMKGGLLARAEVLTWLAYIEDARSAA